jgi:putative DNA primase/helicase
MCNLSLHGLDISPGEFLGAFFQAAERVCLRVFGDKPVDAFSGMKLETEQGHFDQIADVLHHHNAQDRGIYFVINYGGHEDAQIKRINAQFMECDDLPLEEQLVKIQAFPLPPSLIVKTRKSLHCYWLVKNGKVDAFRRVQRGLIAHFGADPACVNESRVFRLPGFNHCKEDPVLVECIKYNPEIRYTQEELAAVLPYVPDESVPGATHTPIKDRGTQKGLVVVGKRCAFLQHCKRNAKTLSEPDWYAMICNLALFKGGESAIHKLSRPYPRYSFQQTQAKIDHFHKSGTRPITCQKIFKGGFVCSKHKNGSCKSKAPAGLAYFPLSVADLAKALAAVKASAEPSANNVLAQAFIDTYMFNIPPVTAEVFINNDIKTHFKFKTADIKGLPGFQRNLYAAFDATHEARRERQGDALPEWYEMTEKGKLIFMPSVLADYCAANEPVIYCGDSYYFYDDGVYKPRNDMAAENFVRGHMRIDRHKTSAQIADAEHQWRMQIDRYVHEINPNPYQLNFSNGLYNILTDELQSHTPDILSTIRLGGSYNPAAECPTFLWYLRDVLPESEIPLVQEILGYMCVPVNKAQKSFVMIGKPDSGKSTLLYVVQDILLRRENCSNLTWQTLDEKFATVQLFGKLANIFADLPSENIRDTGTFKAITGEDYISAQHKFRDYFSFKPFCRLLFSCNNIPKNYTDRSDGFYRRLILIRFDHTIPEDKKDGFLKEKLLLEADGILAWSLIGLKRLMDNGYRYSETDRTQAELTSYKTDNSSVLAFIDECCTIGDGEILREELYNAYMEYCNSGGQKAVSQKRFNGDLDSVSGMERSLEAVSRRKTWKGVRLL